MSIEDRGYCSKKFLSFRQVDKQRVIVWAAKLVVIQSQMCHMDMFYGALRHWNSCCRMIIFMLGFKTWGGSNGNSKVQIETWFSGDFFLVDSFKISLTFKSHFRRLEVSFWWCTVLGIDDICKTIPCQHFSVTLETNLENSRRPSSVTVCRESVAATSMWIGARKWIFFAISCE